MSSTAKEIKPFPPASNPINPPKPRSADPPVDESKALKPVDKNGELVLNGFADGVKYMASRYWDLFREDPIVSIEVMVAINMAEKGYNPPDLVESYFSSGRVNWRTQLDEIREHWKVHGSALPEMKVVKAGKAGRPKLTDLHWSEE